MNHDPYTQRAFATLGELDPFGIIEETPGWLEKTAAGMSDGLLRKPEKPGKWSIIEVAQHMADTELVFSWRLRMMLTHDQPPIQAFDENLWAKGLRYNEANFGDALAQYRAVRTANARLLRSLEPAQFERFGMHSERGRETVRDTLKLMAAHDLMHRNQIDRIRAAVAA